jgi:hypothetical protein
LIPARRLSEELVEVPARAPNAPDARASAALPQASSSPAPIPPRYAGRDMPDALAERT